MEKQHPQVHANIILLYLFSSCKHGYSVFWSYMPSTHSFNVPNHFSYLSHPTIMFSFSFLGFTEPN